MYVEIGAMAAFLFPPTLGPLCVFTPCLLRVGRGGHAAMSILSAGSRDPGVLAGPIGGRSSYSSPASSAR